MQDFKYCPSCGGQNNTAAQFCQTCGTRYGGEKKLAKEQSKLRRLLNSPVFLVLILGSLFLGYYALTGEFPMAEKSAQSSSAVTLEAYQSIQPGMTYDRTCELIGKAGIEQHRSEISGHVSVTYLWRADGLGSMIATFQDDKLVSKSQFGLK
jgi:hypothetical protein